MNSAKHPCFNGAAHGQFGRIHLPVASECNITCAYCNRKTDCVNESRPGVCSRVLGPEEAAALVDTAVERMPSLSVAGISGPGDPLATPEATLRTFELVRHRHPDMLLCLSTNGLALADYVPDLSDIGVNHVTITINAVSASVGQKIYPRVSFNGGVLLGRDAAATLLEQQEKALAALREHDITVKINTVVIPGINDDHVVDIARHVYGYGAALMNLIAVMPLSGTPLHDARPPSPAHMDKLRALAGEYIPQMRHCARCRADAFGLISENGRIDDVLGNYPSSDSKYSRTETGTAFG